VIICLVVSNIFQTRDNIAIAPCGTAGTLVSQISLLRYMHTSPTSFAKDAVFIRLLFVEYSANQLYAGSNFFSYIPAPHCFRPVTYSD
jgi:hypothetical protein